MAVSDTLLNTLFDGRYRIVRKLGAGGMANVYLAEDEVLGRRVAIKILNDRHAGDDQFVERFRREAKNAASLSHPNIVSIYDRGEAEGTYYIAMEYLDGRSLKELIVARGPAPVHIAIDYARQILAAIRFAHRHGIVHRDIKPHNVLVDAEGRLKVTDFGIARAGTSQMTEAGSIIGTAQYLSPEQARGAHVDNRSDIYSVGVVLYELLTGELPFAGETPVEIAMKHLSQAPRRPSELRPEVPRDMDAITLRALAKDPEDRYASAEEMDAELARVARGLAVSRETEEAATSVLSGAGIAAPTTITRAPTQVRRRPAASYYDYEYEPAVPTRRSAWPWLLGIGLLIAAAIGAWYLYGQIQDQLNANKPVAVEYYVGNTESVAVRRIREKGLRPVVKRRFNNNVEKTRVFDQDHQAGDRIDKGNAVVIFVSEGKAKAKVPDVRGLPLADAISRLADRNLKADPHDVHSDKPEGTITAQSPSPGDVVLQGAKVRINVSQGPRPVSVPNVIGQPYENAASALQGAGFSVAKEVVESDQPKGNVVDQSPGAGSEAALGSKITLRVSKGPTSTLVPDVTSLDSDTATATLEGSGFKVKVNETDVFDPSQDGVVLSQEPGPDTEAKPGSKVVITVGRFAGDNSQQP
jgi:beta-lactam-binding protein with PASTA domain/tRNA A-37 threonylcarbamoyl transferase component Bud32